MWSRSLAALTRQPVLVTVLAALAVGAWLRLSNIPQTAMFAGDQGRDALVVSQIFRAGDPVLIGPVTSIGNMYLGPFYYYFMLPFLWLSYPNPLGPVYAVALISILTIWLVYKLGKEVLGETTAVLATVLLAVSASSIALARFSWNPNLAPLGGIIIFWAVYRAVTKSAWYWAVVALCLAILIQLHYVTLLAGVGAGVVWLGQLWQTLRSSDPRKGHHLRQQLLATLAGAIIFLASFTPLVIFDLRHNFTNSRAFQALFTSEQAFSDATEVTLASKLGNRIKEMHGRSLHILLEHTIGEHRRINTLLVAVAIVGIIIAIHRKRLQTGHWILLSFIITGIIGTAFYQHSLFDHYIAYLFPLVFLFWGWLLSLVWEYRWLRPAVLAVVIIFAIVNVPRWPQPAPESRLLSIARAAEVIVANLGPDETYFPILLSGSGDLYGLNYVYYLHTLDRPPLPVAEAGNADILVVINEERYPDQVADLPIYEIVTFPDKSQPEVYTSPDGIPIIFFRRQLE